MNKALVISIFLAILIFSCHLDKLTDSTNDCLNPPAASFSIEGGGADCQAPCTVKFINSSTNSISYKLKFGDGDSTTFTSGEILHTYDSVGVFSASLIAFGDNNCPSSTITKQVTVTSIGCPNPPAALFSIQGGGANCQAPCSIKFINNSTNATSYLLNFGDGNSTTNFISGEITHIYDSAGVFTATLTVFGGVECPSNTFPQEITVLSSGSAPIAAFDYNLSNNSGFAPCNVVFANNSTNGTSYTWNFGDNSSTSNIIAPSHSYQCPGDYVVTLTASNNFGSNSITKIVKINPQTFFKLFNIGNTNFNYFSIGYSVQQTNDKGYVVCGGKSYPTSQGDTSVLIFSKFDKDGNMVIADISDYLSYYFNPGIATSVLQKPNGKYIILVKRENDNNLYMFNDIEQSQQGNYSIFDVGMEGGGGSLIQTSDGGYAFVGEKSISSQKSLVYVVKTNASGVMIDEKTYDFGEISEGSSIQQTPDNGFIITGTIYDQNYQNNKIFLLKTDEALNIQKTEYYSGLGTASGSKVKVTSDGGYIVSGNTGENGNIESKTILFKVTANLNQILFQNYYNDGSSAGDVIETDEGNFIYPGFNTTRIINNSGGLISEISTKIAIAFSIDKTDDCGYIITGLGQSQNIDEFGLLLNKIDKNGN